MINCKECDIMNKDELKSIVNKSNDLLFSSKRKIINQIRKEKITTKEELEKEIQNEKRKPEFRKIVNDSNLDYDSKRKLESKINNEEITTKKELEKEIEYRKIINESNLDYTSKQKLESKINNEEITTKEELKKEINEEIQNKKRKTEYRKIVIEKNRI